jgi:hypothetical protein
MPRGQSLLHLQQPSEDLPNTHTIAHGELLLQLREKR